MANRSDELDAIKVCGAIADAQRDYYSTLHDGASVHQYAQRFGSTAGTQDGLFWKVEAGSQRVHLVRSSLRRRTKAISITPAANRIPSTATFTGC